LTRRKPDEIFDEVEKRFGKSLNRENMSRGNPDMVLGIFNALLDSLETAEMNPIYEPPLVPNNLS